MTRQNILRTSVLYFICLGLLKTQCAFALQQSPIGTWLDQSEKGAIEIKPCGDKLCGHLVWIRDAEGVEGCGLQIIGGARQINDGLWDGGWIYSPEKNRKYDVELKPLSNGTLRVKGYAGTKIFSRTMIWKPAPNTLDLCQDKKQKDTTSSQETDFLIEKKDTNSVLVPKEKIAKAEPTLPINEMTPPPTNNGELNVKKEEKSGQKQRSQEISTNGKDKVSTAAPITKEALPKEGGKTNKKEKSSMVSDMSSGSLKQKLAELQKETGFGVTKIGNGICRLKVPFVTVRIRCD